MFAGSYCFFSTFAFVPLTGVLNVSCKVRAVAMTLQQRLFCALQLCHIGKAGESFPSVHSLSEALVLFSEPLDSSGKPFHMIEDERI